MLTSDNQVPLTGSEKAAIVLLTLGPAVSAEILKRLPEDEVDLISSAIARLDSVTPAQREAVMERFQTAVEGRSVHIKGGLEHARILLTEAFGREQASRLIDRVAKSLDQDAVDFSNLRRVDPQQLAKFIQDEHPQTIASGAFPSGFIASRRPDLISTYRNPFGCCRSHGRIGTNFS